MEIELFFIIENYLNLLHRCNCPWLSPWAFLINTLRQERGRNMTSIELQLCDILGGLFKLSAQRGISSAEFIKVFMKSATVKALDSTYNRMQWVGEEYLLEEVIDEAGDRIEKPGEVYSEELIYWIG